MNPLLAAIDLLEALPRVVQYHRNTIVIQTEIRLNFSFYIGYD